MVISSRTLQNQNKSMEIEDSLLADEKPVLGYKKCLSLEARHSKANETARNIRLNLSASIFIPQQKPLKPPACSSKISLNTSPEKVEQLSDTEKPEVSSKSNLHILKDSKSSVKHKDDCESKLNLDINPKKRKQEQYRKFISERRHVIETKLSLPLENSQQTAEVPEVLIDRSIEDELKRMGLEVGSDQMQQESTETQEAPFKSTNDIVESLIFDKPPNCMESYNTNTKKENSKDVNITTTKVTTNLKGVKFKKPKRNYKKLIKSKKDELVKNKPLQLRLTTDTSAPPTQTDANDTTALRSLTHKSLNSKFAIQHQFESYNDSLCAVKEFQYLVGLTMTAGHASFLDQEINKDLENLKESITTFSTFLFKTYQDIDLMNLLPSRISTTPVCMDQPEQNFIVRIDAPNMPEQIITFKAAEILQNTLASRAKGQFMRQERENKENEKKTKKKIQKEFKKTMAFKIQPPPMAGHNISPPNEPAIYPAYRNQSPVEEIQRAPLNEANAHTAPRHSSLLTTSSHPVTPQAVSTYASLSNSLNTFPLFVFPAPAIPQDIHQNSFNTMHSLPPLTTNSYESVSRKKASEQPKPSTLTCNEPCPPQTANFLRPTANFQPTNFPMLSYPSLDSREFIPMPYPAICHPILTPPQYPDRQSSPLFRPIPHYPPPTYSQAIFVSMTPPLEDLRNESTQPLPPPPIFQAPFGLYGHNVNPYVQKKMDLSRYTNYYGNLDLTTPSIYP